MSPEHWVGQSAFMLLHEGHSHRIILQELKHLLCGWELVLKLLEHVEVQSNIPAFHRLLPRGRPIAAIRGVLLQRYLLSLLFLVIVGGIRRLRLMIQVDWYVTRDAHIHVSEILQRARVVLNASLPIQLVLINLDVLIVMLTHLLTKGASSFQNGLFLEVLIQILLIYRRA